MTRLIPVALLLLTLLMAACGPTLSEEDQIVDVLDRIATQEEWSPTGELEGESVMWQHDVSLAKAAAAQLENSLRNTHRAQVVDVAEGGARDPVHMIVDSDGIYHISFVGSYMTVEPTDEKDAATFAD